MGRQWDIALPLFFLNYSGNITNVYFLPFYI